MASGGAKGITAECAFALLLGTSPEDAPGAEALDNLQRLADEGLEAAYLQCDVADPAAAAGLVRGASVNAPAPAGGKSTHVKVSPRPTACTTASTSPPAGRPSPRAAPRVSSCWIAKGRASLGESASLNLTFAPFSAVSYLPQAGS